MSRPIRIEFPGAWYHVMNRGRKRTDIVRSDKDRQLFFDLVAETSQIFGIQIHAYSLMNNHYHLLIHTPQPGLSRAMRHLNGLFTQKVNKRWKSDGSLFRGRYKAILVDSDEYILELVRYIHLNPVEGGLCTKPTEHQWTSHMAYLKRNSRPSWLWTEEVLGRFGSSEKKALEKMDCFVNAGVSHTFKQNLKKSAVILGSKGFAEWVYQNFVDREKKEIPLHERKPQPKVSMRRLLGHISLAYNTTIAELRVGVAGKKNAGREIAVYLARHLSGLSQREIAQWLGFQNANAAAQMQYRFKRRLEREGKLKKRLRIIQASILNNIKT
jgi:REP element-mobilizing transposase RayT